MKLKLDANGNAVLKDGMPVYIHDDGKEIEFDAARAFKTIKDLNEENRKHREEKEAAIKKLEVYGDLDAEAAKKALETVKSYDQKKMVDAGEVEKVKAEAVEAFKKQLEETKTSYEAKISELKSSTESKDSQIFNLMVKNRFSSSKVVSDKLSIPADMVEAKFGNNFKIEDGKVIAYLDGKKIYSRKNAGEFADFEEALEVMIDAYPNKDTILRGSGASGSGAGAGGKTQMTPDLMKLSPVERINAARANKT